MGTGPDRSGERGIALIMVLWFVVAMATLAMGYTALSRAETQRSHNAVEAIEGRAVLEAALARTAQELGEPYPMWRLDGSLVRWSFEGLPVLIRIERESGKVDLNKGSEPLIEQLMPALGFASDKGAEIADAILDWRDADDLKRKSGAEARDYSRADRAYGPANGPFLHLNELRDLLPMDPASFTRLEPYLTIYSGAEQPEATMAAPVVQEVLESLGQDTGANPSADNNDADNAGSAGSDQANGQGSQRSTDIPRRADKTVFSQPRELQRDAKSAARRTAEDAAFDLDPRSLYTIRLDTRLPGGYEAHADVVIWMSSTDQRPYRILDWDPAPLRVAEGS
jgi:general secretion pathway protein K